MDAGIDYGMGRTNIDHATGIRYGVIAANGDICQAWADSSEGDYGDPACPECGNVVKTADDPDRVIIGDPDDYQTHGCADYACDACRHLWDSSDVFGDEPIGYVLDDAVYSAQSCLDSDIMITRSPYYTYARFCSPCVPGAGNLDTPTDPESGVKTYCFGADWYQDDDGDKYVPFPIYSVADGSLVAAATVQPEE